MYNFYYIDNYGFLVLGIGTEKLWNLLWGHAFFPTNYGVNWWQRINWLEEWDSLDSEDLQDAECLKVKSYYVPKHCQTQASAERNIKANQNINN